jgi:hypothetical protein
VSATNQSVLAGSAHVVVSATVQSMLAGSAPVVVSATVQSMLAGSAHVALVLVPHPLMTQLYMAVGFDLQHSHQS